MPNTLAHFGVQGPLSRLSAGTIDVKWVLLGCVLPDLPWIAKRSVTVLAPGLFDPVSLRLYAIVQASLAFSLLMAAALALLATRPLPVFGVLASGAFLHLLLDALQTKWGNGAHFLAPFSWDMVNVGWFWPESIITVLITVMGVAYLAWEWRHRKATRRIVVHFARRRVLAAGVLAVVYLGSPPVFFDQVVASGSHHLDVVTGGAEMVGRELALDRVGYRPSGGDGARGGWLSVPGRRMWAVGDLPSGEASISVRGRLEAPGTVRVSEYHAHVPYGRELASVLGLTLLAAVWLNELRTSTDP